MKLIQHLANDTRNILEKFQNLQKVLHFRLMKILHIVVFVLVSAGYSRKIKALMYLKM